MSTTKIEWDKFISVDSNWVAKLLLEHKTSEEPKLVMRIYSLQFSGQRYETTAFVHHFVNSIKKYVLSEKEIQALEKNGEEPFVKAREFFGDVDPTFDGKYGELILYLMTEAVLKVPLIAYKMPTNPNDQIKGGDGVFCGDYKGDPSILIGEAKTWGNLNSALTDAFKSLNKLYDNSDSTPTSYEYFVAKRNLRADLSKDELDYIYNCLTPGTKEYMARNKVHPVLIMYDEEGVAKINATNKEDGEAKLKKLFEEKLDQYKNSISKLCETFKEVSSVNLDFFLIPLNSVDDFKKALYKVLHGTDWKPTQKIITAKRKKSKGKST